MEVIWKDWQANEQLRWASRRYQTTQLQQQWQRVGIRQPETTPPAFEIEYEWRCIPLVAVD